MVDLTVTPGIVIPEAELGWKSVRASGPGGQNVNKVASKVELRFNVQSSQVLAPGVKQRLLMLGQGKLDAEGCLVLVSQITRDRSRNLEDAREKLADLVRQALIVPKKRKRTRPTRGSTERRLRTKREQALKKQARRGED